MGGADVIRQALAAGLVDELTIIVAPVVLGGGKRLFDGFTRSLDSSTSASGSRVRDVHRLRASGVVERLDPRSAALRESALRCSGTWCVPLSPPWPRWAPGFSTAPGAGADAGVVLSSTGQLSISVREKPGELDGQAPA